MTFVIDVLADSESQSTARNHVRDIVIVSRDASDADGGRGCISSDLNAAMIVVFIGDDGCHGPCLGGMTGGERASAIEEFAAIHSVVGPRALRNAFQCSVNNHAVN